MKHDIIQDELKRLTNRAIAKLLDNLGDSVNAPQIKLIKGSFRLLENDIRNNIFSQDNQNDKSKFISK